MRALVAVVLAALALALPASALGDEVPVREVAFYHIGFLAGALPRYQVLDSQGEWERFYDQIGVLAPAPPDFKAEVVLAADQGPRDLECDFGIRRVQQAPGFRIVAVHNAVAGPPGEFCLLIPAHLVHLAAVPRAFGGYVFTDQFYATPVGADVG